MLPGRILASRFSPQEAAISVFTALHQVVPLCPRNNSPRGSPRSRSTPSLQQENHEDRQWLLAPAPPCKALRGAVGPRRDPVAEWPPGVTSLADKHLRERQGAMDPPVRFMLL
ncbi:hypothetical protein NDU88_005509 [Pleurodeles waltl]|uniref:Uncharacterized protein n=1 Tax=Pleurodeles waltl TaxID=8319 RepID=A0AAV7WAV6_PLEWA|nr:hypothetical protein NDU88_005509 [Pleurodeles waltl]